ncbi:MAG: ankyrin repeat domain-containing protein [Acidobacteriota bacterium]|nr:ankyrin repeat domain-containing protein [Acidobacteriota bacterium]
MKSQRPVSLIFSVLFVVFAFSQIAFSQIPPPRYTFLEVVDYKNEPVADASVRRVSFNYYDEPTIEDGNLVAKTNQKGLSEKRIEIHYDDSEMRFSIDKAGFYPYFDYFGLFSYRNGNYRENPLRVELLIIPQNSAERKAVGSQQQKREFFGAARRGDAAQVRKFIKSGLSPNLTTAELRGIPLETQEPIILYAVKSGNGETVKEFLSAGVKVNRKDEPIKSILTRYLNVYPSRRNFSGTEANEAAMISAYEAGAISLIEAGANVNPEEKGTLTPLMLAAQKQYVQIVKKLLEKRAFVDAQDAYGRTALMYLMVYHKPKQRLEIADLLIKAGANVNLLTSETPYSEYNINSCKTALSVAVESFDVEMVKLLLANGADVNLTCKDGFTPLNYARKISSYVADREKTEIIKILEEAGAL